MFYLFIFKVEVENQTYHSNPNYEYEDILPETEDKDFELNCGGTIIDAHFIVTSAHCCTDIKDSKTPLPRILLGTDKVIRPYKLL